SLAVVLRSSLSLSFVLFFSNAPATTAIYTLSLHDALPISSASPSSVAVAYAPSTSRAACAPRTDSMSACTSRSAASAPSGPRNRSEEHTSELQSQSNLVCRLLLEKKKKQHTSKRHRRRALH